MKLKYYILIFFLILLVSYIAIQPSNNRNWNTDQQILSYAEIDNNTIHIKNIRNFTYTTTTNYTIQYYNKTYNLDDLDSLYFMVERFGEWEGAAHTLFSFGFKDEYVVISVEIRKEVGESFSATKGLFKQYELMYVIGDENDLIKLRTNYRNDTVYLYPANTTKEKIQNLFLDMIKRTNKLKDKPEFYNTLTSTCTTNLVEHINTITPRKVPFSTKVLTPGYVDQLAYDLDLIHKQGNFTETRKYFKINTRAETCNNCTNFSQIIRNFE